MKSWIILILLLSANLYALTQKEFSDRTDVPALRWGLTQKNSAVLKKRYAPLRDIRNYQAVGNYQACVEQVNKTYSSFREMRPWLLNEKFFCVLKDDRDRYRLKRNARSAVSQLEKNLWWLTEPPYGGALEESYTKVLTHLFEAEVHTNDSNAHKTFDKLMARKVAITADTLSDIYKNYAEFLLLRQNVKQAIYFFERSLSLNDDKEVIARLRRLDHEGRLPKKKVAPPKKAFLSEEEKEIVDRFDTAIANDNYLTAVEDGINLIREFPKSENALRAFDTLTQIYLQIVDNQKTRSLGPELLSKYQTVPVDKVYEWGQLFFSSGYYVDAQVLLKNATDRMDGLAQQIDAMYLYARSLQLTGNYKQAYLFFEKVSHRAAGSEIAAKSMFYAALSAIRTQQPSLAVSYFERLLKTKWGEDYEINARYWLWYLLKEQSPSRAEENKKHLISDFPYTFYALIVAAESNDQKTVVRREKYKSFSINLHLSDNLKQRFERLNTLLSIGWLKEARLELEALPQPRHPAEMSVYARFWAAALDYRQAIRLVNEAWERDDSFRATNLLELAYPKEFAPQIERRALSNGLKPALIRSIVRQESAFFVHAQSSSGALGLMQLLPETARSVAEELNLSKLSLNDLYKPEVNIQLGSHYLAMMIKRFAGHVGLGIAAYNLGPSRLQKYIETRGWSVEDLKSVEGHLANLWIDEMPWLETRFYVKSVLRNVVIYETLDKGALKFTTPYWTFAQSRFANSAAPSE